MSTLHRLLPLFFFCWFGHHRDLHSFPTRRSSDLARVASTLVGSGAFGSVRGSSATGLVYMKPLRSEEHTSELQSRRDLVCRLLLEKKKKQKHINQLHKNSDSRHLRRIQHTLELFSVLIFYECQRCTACCRCFFFVGSATTEIYTLSLHDALPIWPGSHRHWSGRARSARCAAAARPAWCT